MKQQITFGIVLDESVINFTGGAIERYLHNGTVGKYIYASNVLDQGYFTHITVQPEEAEKVECPMTIWVPTQFVKFVVQSSEEKSLLGFHTGSPSSDQS